MVRPGRTIWSWPLLVLAAPAAAGCGPGGSASRRRPGSAWSPRCRASGPRCTWTPPPPSRSASRPTPRSRCAPGCPATARSAHGPAGSPGGLRSAPSRSGWPVAYHLMALAGMARAPWTITTVVSCLPVLVLGMGTALAHMLRADAEATEPPDSGTEPPVGLRSVASWSSKDQDGPDRRSPRPQSTTRQHDRRPSPGTAVKRELRG